MAPKEDNVMISASVIYRKDKKDESKKEWFIVKTNDGEGWELPKTIVRRGESSVRGSLRMTAEQGGMRTKVIEEVGRFSGATKVNGRPATQKTLYYLLQCKDGGEVIGFNEHAWVDAKVALKRLSSKKDISMLEDARNILKELEKNNDKRMTDEPDEIDLDEAVI